LAVISSLTWGAANIVKVVFSSATPGTNSETGVQCGDVMFSVIIRLLIAELTHGLHYWLPPCHSGAIQIRSLLLWPPYV